jgi:DNA-binding response OmpR family regulator
MIARFPLVVDGDAALAAITEHVPALAVLNVAMPATDGLTVLERVRDDPATADVPVLLLSAGVHDADVARGMARRANTYVEKPFEAQELVSAVEALLERQPQKLAS